MKPIRHCLPATGLILLCGWAGAQQPAATPISFTIEAQPIEDALNQFAQQTGLQLLLPAGEAEGIRAPRVEGTYTPQIALTKLLGDSGLRYEFVNDRTVSIHSSAGEKRRSVADESEEHAKNNGASTIEWSQTFEESSTGDRPPHGKIVLAQAERSDSLSEKASSTDAEKENTLAEVLITGTQIRGIAPDSSPLKTYDRAYIEESGAATVEQFVRLLPENFSSNDSTTYGRSNGVTQSGSSFIGQSGINLHGNGPSSTLVLINGHRMSPAGESGAIFDVSTIPLSAVERVEVLTDGASALYGADAIAGVVNFVLRKDFQGAKTSISQGVATQGGGGQLSASQTLGARWNGGNGMFIYEYDNQHGIFSDERDFSSAVPGDATLLPPSKRNSVFLTMSQSVSDGNTLSADAFYSSKQTEITNLDSNLDSLVAEGDVTRYGGTVSLDRAFSNYWHADATANYSMLKQESAAFGSSFLTDSSVAQADVRASGSLLSTQKVKMAVGSSFRAERSDQPTRSIQVVHRNVWSIYGELFFPFYDGRSNSPFFIRRLELSAAARYDHYDDVGAATSPKIGVLWSPIEGLNFRSTYAKSFRAPLLNQIVPFSSYRALVLPDPSAPDEVTTTLRDTSIDGTLRPEKAESLTIGMDFKLRSLPELSLSATYFNIKFTERIGGVPLIGGIFNLYRDPIATDFIDRTPDLATIQAIYSSGALINPGNIPPESVEAIYADHLFNLARSEESGVDLSASYVVQTSIGRWGLDVSGSHLFEVMNQPYTRSPEVDFVNTTSQPIDFRLRGALRWLQGNFSSALSFNYSDSYQNNLFSPARRVSSWTTFGLNIGYQFSERANMGLLQGLEVSLNAQNLTDKDPPFLETDESVLADQRIGYDPANASPVGQFISLHLSKQW